MSSNGLIKRAKKGTCRMCQRRRCTEKYVHPVGEVHHGYATGYVWQCIDIKECKETVDKKLKEYNLESINYRKIKFAVEKFQWKVEL